MAEPPTNYSASGLVKALHSLPHYNFDFHSVDSDFKPEDSDYRASLVQCALPLAVIAVFFLLYFIIQLCFCKNKLTETQPYNPSTTNLVRLAILFLCVLTCACVGLAYAGDVRLTAGGNDFGSELKSIDRQFQHILDSATMVSELANTTVDTIDGLTFPPETESTAEDMRAKLATSSSFIDAIVLKGKVFDVAFLQDKLKEGNHYRSVTTLSFAGLVGVLVVLVMIASLIKSRRFMKCGALLFIPCFFICWIIATTEFAFNVGLADFCADPNTYAISAVDEEVVQYYIACAPESTNPFRTDVDSGLQFVQASLRDANEIRQQSPTPDLTQVINNLNLINTNLTGLAVELDCAALHKDYVDSLSAICDSGLDGLFMLMLALGLVGLFQVILIILLIRAWKMYDERIGYFIMDSMEPNEFADYETPLLMGSGKKYGAQTSL
eukprot:m.43410 g.43410  ORF g.43410 m.43410 type:complete len:439 (+) comp17131_c0_seq3:152-1468(+)